MDSYNLSLAATPAVVFAWLSCAFGLIGLILVTYLVATSFTQLRLSLLFILLLQCCITVANLLRAYTVIPKLWYDAIDVFGGIVYADVLIILLIRIAAPFYFAQERINTWYWISISTATIATLMTPAGVALRFIGMTSIGDPICNAVYATCIVSVTCTFWYTLWPLLQTKREKYGDTVPFVVGIWYLSALTICIVCYIAIFTWEMIVQGTLDLEIVSSSFAYIFRMLLLVIYSLPPPKPVIPFIQMNIFGVSPTAPTRPSSPTNTIHPLSDEDAWTAGTSIASTITKVEPATQLVWMGGGSGRGLDPRLFTCLP